jgi:hypothetical protein
LPANTLSPAGLTALCAAQWCTSRCPSLTNRAPPDAWPLARVPSSNTHCLHLLASLPSVLQVVHKPLPLTERMIALAAAISVDYNFFSQHSSSGGLISPPLFMPVPLPGGGMGGGEAAGAGGAADGAAAGGAAAGATGALMIC